MKVAYGRVSSSGPIVTIILFHQAHGGNEAHCEDILADGVLSIRWPARVEWFMSERKSVASSYLVPTPVDPRTPISGD
jgi:hypothetical protein